MNFKRLLKFYLKKNQNSCNFASKHQFFSMNTPVSIDIYDNDNNNTITQIVQRFTDIENRMSLYEPRSEISIINRSAGDLKWCTISSETMYVMKVAKIVSRISNGSFDVTIAPLVKLWGIVKQTPEVPKYGDIEKAIKFVNYKNLQTLKKGLNYTRLIEKGQMIDLGGIAKGFAADEAVRILNQNSIKSACINIGGNVSVIGNKKDDDLWKVGIQNPRAKRGVIIGYLSVKEMAVVTSGDYERFFEKDRKRYHHIISPLTGYPVDTDIISSTVITKKAIWADALSTAMFVLGLEKSLSLVEQIKGVEVVLITKNKEIYTSSGIKNSFTFLDNDKSGFVYLK